MEKNEECKLGVGWGRGGGWVGVYLQTYFNAKNTPKKKKIYILPEATSFFHSSAQFTSSLVTRHDLKILSPNNSSLLPYLSKRYPTNY